MPMKSRLSPKRRERLLNAAELRRPSVPDLLSVAESTPHSDSESVIEAGEPMSSKPIPLTLE